MHGLFSSLKEHCPKFFPLICTLFTVGTHAMQGLELSQHVTDVWPSVAPFLLAPLGANQREKTFGQCSLNELKVPCKT